MSPFFTYNPQPGDSPFVRLVLRCCCLVGWCAGTVTRRWQKWRAKRLFARDARRSIAESVAWIENTYGGSKQ